MKHWLLKLDLIGPWHAGTGLNAGAKTDAVALRDEQGFPTLAGKSLAGLIRDALLQADAFGWLPAALALPSYQSEQQHSTITELLFGIPNQASHGQGCVYISNAGLSEADKQLMYAENKYQGQHLLFQNYFQTAINHKGSAQAHSLRSIEAAIPLTLYAQLSIDPSVSNQHLASDINEQELFSQVEQWLHIALPLITHLGAYRNRGFGEVIISLMAVEELAA